MKRLSQLVAFVLVATALAVPAQAQSGRRPPPRRPEPPSAPPTTGPVPVTTTGTGPVTESTAPAIPISAAKYVSSFNLPNSVCDYVLRACIDRFKKNANSFKVLSGDDMNRKKAADLAKSGTETYVLLLEFSFDRDDLDRGMIEPEVLRNVIVVYTVFTPETGKIRTTGRLYFDADRNYANNNGGVLGTIARSTQGARNYTPDQAGQKVAEYVMDSLATAGSTSIPVPR
jgi:hypothetical protein